MTEIKWYQVIEQGDGVEATSYLMSFQSEAELTRWLEGKRAWHDEKKYSIVAWHIGKDNQCYIDIEKYWNRLRFHLDMQNKRRRKAV